MLLVFVIIYDAPGLEYDPTLTLTTPSPPIWPHPSNPCAHLLQLPCLLASPAPAECPRHIPRRRLCVHRLVRRILVAHVRERRIRREHDRVRARVRSRRPHGDGRERARRGVLGEVAEVEEEARRHGHRDRGRGAREADFRARLRGVSAARGSAERQGGAHREELWEQEDG